MTGAVEVEEAVALGSKPWTFCPSQRRASGNSWTQTESR